MAKKKNPMGVIYPKRIQSILDGGVPKVQTGYTPKKERITRKEGEHWVDKDGKEWEFKNGIAQSVPRFKDVRVPLFCPKCNKVMGKSSKDTQVYYQFGFCLNCLIERDAKMIEDGTYLEYERKYIKSKKIGFFRDAKVEIEEYLRQINKGLEFVNEDGSFDKWSPEDTKKLKEFWQKELDFVNEQIEKLKEETENA